MDILFVKPGSQKQLYGELSAYKLTAIEPPMWGALLAGFMRAKGYAIGLYDAEVENWSYEETARRIEEAAPALALIVASGSNPSASTMNMSGIRAILKHLKQIAPELKTAVWGLHPSALPERTMREEPVDFVCVGEGFHTLPPLVDALKAHSDDVDGIPGLVHQKDGQIVMNRPAELLKDLDSLPLSAWDLLPIDRYRAHNWHCFDDINARQPYAVIHTSLGCPFNCSFCCINALFGGRGIRYRSPERVVEEVDYLVHTWNVRNIKIMDEMFAMNEARISRLCDLIAERGYDLNIWSYARVNTVTAPMLRKMKRAGINWVGYGFEAGNEKVLKDVSKGYKFKAIDDVVRMTRDAGIYIGANFIFGLPEDGYDSMRQTLDMAVEINGEWANFYSAMAYPGSRLYEEAVEQGLPLPETWQGYSQYAYEALPLATKHLTGGQVLAFRDRAFKEYFSGARYLDMVRGTFGPETVAAVRNMLRKDLKRKYAVNEECEVCHAR